MMQERRNKSPVVDASRRSLLSLPFTTVAGKVVYGGGGGGGGDINSGRAFHGVFEAGAINIAGLQ